MRGIDKSPGGGLNICTQEFKIWGNMWTNLLSRTYRMHFFRIVGSYNNNKTVGTWYLLQETYTTSNVTDFISSLANIVSRINTNDIKYIVGDFNLNLFNIALFI